MLRTHLVGRTDIVLLLCLERVHVVVQVMVLGHVVVDSLTFEAFHALSRLIVVDDRLQVVLYLRLVLKGGASATVGAHFHLRLEPGHLLLRHLYRGLDR